MNFPAHSSHALDLRSSPQGFGAPPQHITPHRSPARHSRPPAFGVPLAIGQGLRSATPVRRILVIDDNVSVRYAMYELLNAEGYDVMMAASGDDGIRLARQSRPDAVLLDIAMPGLDGYSVARVLRHDEQFRDTMLIAVTSFGSVQDIKMAKEAGFDHFFQKPVNIDSMLVLLAS